MILFFFFGFGLKVTQISLMFWYLHQDWWHYNTFIKVYISHEFAKVLFFVVKLHYRFLYESIFHRTLLTLPAIVWLLPRCPRCLPWDGPYCVSSLSMCEPEKSHQLKVYSIYNNNPQQNTNIKYYTINSKFRIHNLVEDIKMYPYSLILTYNKHNSALNNNQQSLTKMFRYFKFSKLKRKRAVRKFFNAIKKYLFDFI